MKNYPLFIRFLWFIGTLSAIILLVFAGFSSWRYSRPSEWRYVGLIHPRAISVIPKSWTYSEGDGEFYCTDKFMNYDDYTLYLTAVYRDKESPVYTRTVDSYQDMVSNKLLGELTELKLTKLDDDLVSDNTVGKVSYLYKGKPRQGFYVSIELRDKMYFLISWDGDVSYETVKKIGDSYWYFFRN